MGNSVDGVGAFLSAMRGVAEGDRPGSSFCLGQVLAAGHGQLRIRAHSLPLELEDLYVNPYLNYHWIKDVGGDNLLRAGDLVVLLSMDSQDYYVICKAVKA